VDRKEIETRAKKVLEDNTKVDPATIKMESLLSDELGIDSFSGIELAFALEDEFHIKIPDQEMARLKTVEDVLKLIESKTIADK
jgi:acyl carrier protein